MFFSLFYLFDSRASNEATFPRNLGIHTVSAIETILDKPSFTLEELLEEDEVLQECRSENAKLLTFLSLPSSLEKLFEYITEEPPASSDR